MRKTRRYTREFKLTVLQEIETKPIIEVCRIHNLAPSTVSGWIKAYKRNPKDAFKGKGNAYKEEAKIAEYERVIGRLYAQNELLRNAYDSMKEQVADDQKKNKLRLR